MRREGGIEMGKKWTKVLLGIMIIGMLALTAGCAGSEDASAEKTAWEKIQEAGVITVGNSPDYPPFETIDDQGNIVGIDIDLMNAIAEELGVEVEIKQMGFDTIITAVQSGQVDIGMSGFSITEERKESVDFTDPYFEGGQVVLTTPDSGIEKIADLNGQTIAVQMGTTCEEAAKTIEGAEIKSLDDFNMAVMMLKNGTVKAVVADISVAKQYVANEGFVIVGEPLTFEETAIIVKKGNDDLRAALNEAIAKIKENGKYDQIMEKWADEL
jgi:polar amino acid transport system substrate-binding protein